MTNYTITIGYRSGSKFKGSEDEAWKILVDVVGQIRKNTSRLIDESLFVEPGYSPEDIRPFAEAYDDGQGDLTLTINDKAQAIQQVASGGNKDRELKEVVRRAFCRLVMFAMHRHGIEICLSVH